MLGKIKRVLKEMTVSFAVAPQPSHGVLVVDKKKLKKPVVTKPDPKK